MCVGGIGGGRRHLEKERGCRRLQAEPKVVKLHARAAAPSAGCGGPTRSLAPPLVKRDSGSLLPPPPRLRPSQDRAARSGTAFQERRLRPAPEGRSRTPLQDTWFIDERRLQESTQTPPGAAFATPEAGAGAFAAVGGGLEVASPMAKTEGSTDREEPWVRFLPHPAR